MTAPNNSVPAGWREAVQEFVDRVERGEIRSVYTHAKFKALLSAPAAPQAVPDIDCREFHELAMDYRGAGVEVVNRAYIRLTNYINARLRAAPVAQAVPVASDLTEPEIDAIWNAMPGGPSEWLKQFGYLQFARAIEEAALMRQPSTRVAFRDATFEEAARDCESQYMDTTLHLVARGFAERIRSLKSTPPAPGDAK